ncbi:hypothetical protein NMG60_11017450 [Bertholletia excelsa]
MASSNSKPLNPLAEEYWRLTLTTLLPPHKMFENPLPAQWFYPTPTILYFNEPYTPFYQSSFQPSGLNFDNTQAQLYQPQLQSQRYYPTFHGGNRWYCTAASVGGESGDSGAKEEQNSVVVDKKVVWEAVGRRKIASRVLPSPRLQKWQREAVVDYYRDKNWAKRNVRKWIPKSCKSDEAASDGVRSSSPHSSPDHQASVPSSLNTTIMIKNIPNQFRRGMLLKFLDEVCRAQNQKQEETDPVHVEYDFMYLPMDFKRKDNYGYAFVNFTTARAAQRIREVLQDYKWGSFKDSVGFPRQSKKICEITWARIQASHTDSIIRFLGKDELMKRFSNSNFSCGNEEYLPVILSPPRDGLATTQGTITMIGRCLPCS